MIATPEQQPVAPRTDNDFERIAAAAGIAPEQVQEIYERELRSLSSEARITQFVGVLALRRVLQRLRSN